MAKVRKKKYLKTANGTELTPEVLDALAAEAERGYDPEKLLKLPVGRPSLSGAGSSPRLNFRVSPGLYGAARKRAEEEDRTVSEIAREALARYVDS